MSAGLVVCSACRREVHQNGPYKYPEKPPGFRESTWQHCEDQTPICIGASAPYADRHEVKGKACFADDFTP